MTVVNVKTTNVVILGYACVDVSVEGIGESSRLGDATEALAACYQVAIGLPPTRGSNELA